MTKKKAARSLDEVELPPWRFVTFTDLHVSAKTLDRAIDLLGRVRATAQEWSQAMGYPVGVVCLGDFWHQRGHLSVRQLDALLAEFQQWAGIETIFIPGNHDQVSVDGKVHGVRVFEAFPNFHVATEPMLWEQSKLAFLPWREEPGEQAKLFTNLKGTDWTVFAHAEVKGATNNSHYQAPGRVNLEQIESHTRACYVGHYHKRQKLGKHTYYIGSPFEMNFGERDMPHGIAVIQQEQVEPHFIDFEDFPKHHRLVYGGSWNAKAVREQDIVEVHAPLDFMGSEKLRAAVQAIPAAEVRTLPREDDDAEVKAPALALSLEEAMSKYVDELGGSDVERYRRRQLGHEILSQVPEAHAIQAIAPEVDIEQLVVTDFCGIRGGYAYAFPDGVTLIRGAMGVGKTSLMDGLTWALFGQTTPRKAGSHGASLRADEVIHDDASECVVNVVLKLKDRKKPVVITRTKKRGAGSKVKITGIKAPDGIEDQQALIHSVLGIDQNLWRTCVYLGQGAVGNFVTDADKKRKELLSTAFGLDACPAALKIARERLKTAEQSVAVLDQSMIRDEAAIETLEGTDYAEQIQAWEAQRKAALESAQAQGEAAKKVIAQCEEHLSAEPQWVQSKADHESHLDKLTKSLSQSNPENRLPELQRQLGAAEAERSRLDREERRVRSELEAHVQGSADCPTCGRPFDPSAREAHAVDLEHQIRVLGTQQSSFNAKIANVQQQITEAQGHNDLASQGLQEQISQSREALQKCAEALNTMAVLKSNKSEAERRLSEARIEYVNREKEVNPFLAKQGEIAGRIATLKSKQAADRVERDALQEKRGDLDVWVAGFGVKGIAVLVLRAALSELETYANTFMNQLLQGRIFCRLSMEGDNLKILFFEVDPATGKVHERRYEQLSGGQRRCVELSFNPFALGEMVFARAGVRINVLIVDELTTHLGAEEKPIVCEMLRDLDRRSVAVIDHDVTVQSEFDQVFEMEGPRGQKEKVQSESHTNAAE